MQRLLFFVALGTLAAAEFSGVGVDLGSDGRSLGAASAAGIAATTRKPLRARDAEDLVAWRGRMDPVNGRSYFAASLAVNKCDGGQNCETKLGSYPYENYMIDPTGDSSQPVLKISYPKGTWSPGSPDPGGALFFAYPYKPNPTSEDNPISSQSATLEYEVYFDPDFDWVKGGKLPGLSGGDRNGRGCGGGVDPDSCFSCRIMWRRDGHGEAYIYAKEGGQRNDFCDAFPECTSKDNYPCNVCNFKAGVSFGRGAFQFKRGDWNKVRVTVTLNDPDTPNGYLGVEFNGKQVISYDGMRWRTKDNMKVEAVEISTWFGGGDDSWATPKDTFIYLRNVKLYRTGPATAAPGARGARSAILEPGTTEQVVLEEKIDVAMY